MPLLAETSHEILKHFERGREMEELIAWNKTLSSLGINDLLFLWNNLPPNHLLFNNEKLTRFFRKRIDECGGFKLMR